MGALSTPSSRGRTSQCRTYALDYLVSSPTIPCWFHNYSFRDRPSASLTLVRVPGRASTKTTSAESFWPAVCACHRRHNYSGIPVDELQELYDTTLLALLDKHAPCRTARHRCQPTSITPWFDADCFYFYLFYFKTSHHFIFITEMKNKNIA